MSTASGAEEPWARLEPGERFRIHSKSGNVYEASYLATGPEDAGIYVRLEKQKLGRLSPRRLNWGTLEKLLKEDALQRGDEILLTPLGGEEKRGRLLEPPDDRIEMSTQRGERFSSPLTHLAKDSFRLLFAASDLRGGDDFLVKSISGKEYRGRSLGIDDSRITCMLAGSRDKVTMRIENLKMDTMRVLVNVPLSLLGCSPAHA